MNGKGKKNVSLEYKEKLVAEIAYYEKRISEALQRSNSNSFNSFEDVESSDEDTNPYTLNITPSMYELKQLEASLGSRVSMTLELAMLTIMQSEVNIMMTSPDVRRPVNEDGTWLEVAAECKIDLVSFTITFYAHKPLRKFAPIRYRNVEVTLVKAAQERELSRSVLSKLNCPNLALQVLQSYASAFRSRRTTLRELAEKYAEKLSMEAMPEGGYRVRFLDLLTVDWSLENMWSPVVPFCHRMKFEVEYMPKEYIHAISRLYKQFKDPSLETPERTRALAQIFDTCLAARGPARDLQESAESDPDTAGRLHERRTTIDQEPEMPSNYAHASPKKLPQGKENKAQNHKTNMEPPKTIPKKAKKVGAKKSRPNSEVSNDESNVSKKSKPNDKEDVVDRKGIKRGIESGMHPNAKKIRSDNDGASNSKNSGDKVSTKGGIGNNDVISDQHNAPYVTSKNNAPKKDSKVASAKTGNSKDDNNKKGDLRSASTNSLKKKGTDDNVSEKNGAKKGSKTIANSKDKDAKGSVDSLKTTKNKPDKQSVINSKPVEEDVTSKKTVHQKKAQIDVNNAADSVRSKKSTQKSDDAKISKEKEKNSANEENSKKVAKKTVDGNTNVVSKNLRDKDSEGLKNVEQKVEKHANKVTDVAKTGNVIDKTALSKVKKVQAGSDGAKNVTNKVDNGDTITNSKNTKVKGTNDPKNVKEKNVQKDTKKASVDTDIETGNKKATSLKEFINAPAKKKAADAISSNANNETTKQKAIKTTQKNKIDVFTKSNDAKSVDKRTGENKDTENPNAKENDAARIRNTKKEMTQKNKMINAIYNNNKNSNYDINKKMTAVTNVEKTKTGSKVNNATENNTKTDIKAKNSNRNETVEDADKNKNATAKTSTTIQSNSKSNKPDNVNPKTTLNNIRSNVAEKRAFQKFTDNKAKTTEKFKSNIPMMKSKIKSSTLTSKLDRNATTKGVEVKSKIPQKSLPVFKKLVKNFPIRMSPRKLPSTFRPASHGLARK